MKKISKRFLLVITVLLVGVLLVACNSGADKKVKDAMDKVTIESLLQDGQSANKLTKDLKALPSTEGDVKISWKSSNVGVLSDTGKVTQLDEDANVTLTAKFTLDEVEKSKEYKFTVLAKEEAEPEPEPEPTTVIAKYPGGTTTKMVEGSNNAEALGLDPSIFNVTSDAIGEYNNIIGLNTDGSIRLYANRGDGEGNTLEISTLGDQIITSIKITYLAGNNTVEGETSGLITFGNAEGIALELADIQSTTKEYTGLNVESFTIKNTTTGTKSGQIWISEIQITYVGGEDIEPVVKHEVSFNSDGGSVVESQTINEGSKATKPANPTKAGFKFLGWFLGEVEFNFDTAITADITLIAKWEEEEEADTITILTARGKDLGDEVTISGVVTRNYNGNIAVNDGTAAIIVYEKDSTVEVGDKILATGTLSEFFQTIQISGGTITVLESEQALPNPVTLTTLENISDYHANHLTIENLEFISIDSSNRNITAKLGDFEVVVRAGSSSGAVADLFKTIKSGDLINVKNVYADSFDGVIQLLVTEIESIEVEEKELTDQEKLDADKAALKLAAAYTEEFTLPIAGANGSVITWVADPASSLADGKLVIPTEGEVEVTLTATLILGTLTETKEFEVTLGAPSGDQVFTATVVYTDHGTNVPSGDITSMFGLDEEIFSVSQVNNEAQNNMHMTANEVRLYSVRATGEGTELVFEIEEGYEIVSIEFTVLASYAASAEIFVDTVSHETYSDYGTVILAENLNAESVSIKNIHTGGSKNIQLRISGIKITYKAK